MKRATLVLASVVAGLVATRPTDARACGGCFHEAKAPTENTTVVTDHRMALSVSPMQTVLWDQVRYQGNPKDFAWVLPVGQGARIELARDEFLQALNLLTAVQVTAPPPVSCPGYPGQYGGGGGGGFGCGAASANSFGADGSAVATADAAYKGNDNVTVVSQETVGPYVAVTIRSSSGEAISQWLLDNGFEIPASIEPVLADYTKGGFDFIALKLAPNQGVQSMQPVRVVTPGADPTLPLRMVAAGIGSSVGLELYVISGGRYETTNFPATTIAPGTIQWDPYQSRSTYTETFASVVGNGAWVTEFSGPLSSLDTVYRAACTNLPDVTISVPCDDGGTQSDASSSSDAASASDAQDDAQMDDADIDAGTSDAQDDSATPSDAQADAGSGTCTNIVPACTFFDDYDTATTGLSPYDVWVTRLRTVLPNTMLDKDLQLGASKSQTAISNRIQTTQYTVPNYNPCPPPPPSYQDKEGCGCTTAGDHDVLVSTTFASLALLTLVRRRRK